jgi:hypothetical protein
LSPGFSLITSPTTISEVGSSISWPSRITVADGGTMSNIARRLSLVPLRLFISIQWPKSTNVTNIAAASKNVSSPITVKSTLDSQAASTPVATSTAMFSARWPSDVQAPPMKIQPAYQTIGAESTSISQLRASIDSISSSPNVLTASGESSTTGIVSASATKKRLRMSRSIAAAIVGSDMSCDMPPWPAWVASAVGSRCSASARVCGSSYCMRSHFVPQVIGASCAVCASRPVVVPPGSPSQR